MKSIFFMTFSTGAKTSWYVRGVYRHRWTDRTNGWCYPYTPAPFGNSTISVILYLEIITHDRVICNAKMSLSHARDGKVPFKCAYRPYCIANSFLTKRLGDMGSTVCDQLTYALFFFLLFVSTKNMAYIPS